MAETNFLDYISGGRNNQICGNMYLVEIEGALRRVPRLRMEAGNVQVGRCDLIPCKNTTSVSDPHDF